jgi:hypothetical protein
MTALAALLLTGCAAPGYWTHEFHADAKQFDRDRKQCDYESTAARPGDPFGQLRLERLCLEARGYIWRTDSRP